MKHKKEQIEKKIKKLLSDIDRPYFESIKFDIEFSNDKKALFLKNNITNAWETVVYVQEDQFPDKQESANIIIVVDDNTGEVESYADLSCGRPVPLKAVQTNGKYELKAL